MAENVYELSADRVLEPPTTFKGKLRHLGPGFILSASIVGSGELIATTNFGAEAGFVCLWIIILSCLVKVALQLEFGKHAIYSGKTTMGAFNDLPGPKFGKASWSIWAWLFAMSLKFLQVGGIIGLVAMAMNTLIPIGPEGEKIGVIFWTVAAGLSVAFLISRGRYALIERWCLVMIGIFTIFTIISVIALQWTDYSITASQIGSGLSFEMPSKLILFAAIAAFGITGVGGDEIMAYNYWLIEKGYASYTGPRPPESDQKAHDAWLARARGWIRIMTLDALFSLLCYTLVTILFYLLGAAVLHVLEGKLEDGQAILGALSKMYTESLGPSAKWMFMVGAVVVLYSTLLAALGAWTRLFADAFSHIGIGDFQDPKRRQKAIAIGSFVITAIWAILYFIIAKPKFMILVGGFITAVILLLVLFAAFVMRFRWSPKQLKPSRLYDLALCLSALAIAFGGVWSISMGLRKFFEKSAEKTALHGSATLPQAHQVPVRPDQQLSIHHHR